MPTWITSFTIGVICIKLCVPLLYEFRAPVHTFVEVVEVGPTNFEVPNSKCCLGTIVLVVCCILGDGCKIDVVSGPDASPNCLVPNFVVTWSELDVLTTCSTVMDAGDVTDNPA